MGGALDSARFRYYLSQALGCSPADLNAMVIGGALDSSRFRYYLSKALDKPSNDISGMVIGGHGDTTMIPLIKHATWNSIPVTNFLTQEQQDKIVADTMVGGATLTKLIGTFARYAPGAGTAAMVESILRDDKKWLLSAVNKDGEPTNCF
jgi:malate dehydrogenase